jgi:NADPH:quinone reductase-like Zn-dependent oxidoreductase
MKPMDVYRMLKKGGSYASTMFFLPTSYIIAFFGNIFVGKKMTSANMRSLPGDYEEIEKLFVGKKLKPVIENRFPLENAEEAFNMAENGKPRGKVIVNV